MAPESFETNAAHRLSTPTSSRRSVRPIRSIDAGAGRQRPILSHGLRRDRRPRRPARTSRRARARAARSPRPRGRRPLLGLAVGRAGRQADQRPAPGRRRCSRSSARRARRLGSGRARRAANPAAGRPRPRTRLAVVVRLMHAARAGAARRASAAAARPAADSPSARGCPRAAPTHAERNEFGKQDGRVEAPRPQLRALASRGSTVRMASWRHAGRLAGRAAPPTARRRSPTRRSRECRRAPPPSPAAPAPHHPASWARG